MECGAAMRSGPPPDASGFSKGARSIAKLLLSLRDAGHGAQRGRFFASHRMTSSYRVCHSEPQSGEESPAFLFSLNTA